MNLITLIVPNQETQQFSFLRLHPVSRSISYVALRSGNNKSGNLKGVVCVGLRMRTCAKNILLERPSRKWAPKKFALSGFQCNSLASLVHIAHNKVN